MKSDLKVKGYSKLKSKVDLNFINSINEVLPKIFYKHEKIRKQNSNFLTYKGLEINYLGKNEILFIYNYFQI
jgi:hypothetical protein